MKSSCVLDGIKRRERVEKGKERDVFGRYGDKARLVVDALLEKFTDHDVRDIEDSKVLELPPFNDIGSRTQTRRGIFSGGDGYAEELKALEEAIYDAQDQKSA